MVLSGVSDVVSPKWQTAGDSGAQNHRSLIAIRMTG